MSTIEKFLILLFGVIGVGIVVTNPKGVKAIFDGFGSFTSDTVGAFSNKQGFRGSGF